jgi:predicted N-acetyltransferase YhbS
MARRGIIFPTKDAALREDVQALGRIVGEVLRDQGGDELFEAVEGDRLAAIGRAALSGSGRGSLDAADLLRQLVYLPNASLLIAESRREVAGGALLVLRPSVTAGGYVGTIDFLVVASDHDADRVTDALVEELVRSAGNKGCSTVEIAQPSDPADLARMGRAGFGPAGPVLRRPLPAAGTVRRL